MHLPSYAITADDGLLLECSAAPCAYFGPPLLPEKLCFFRRGRPVTVVCRRLLSFMT